MKAKMVSAWRRVMKINNGAGAAREKAKIMASAINIENVSNGEKLKKMKWRRLNEMAKKWHHQRRQ
jgi:hypothetical protein